jgi:hypothetical protein
MEWKIYTIVTGMVCGQKFVNIVLKKLISTSKGIARYARRITAAEMKYMRRTAAYTWTDYKTNTQITKELKITPILDKMLEYKRN